jgi:tetratricopeptide (TPR) repeat protein
LGEPQLEGKDAKRLAERAAGRELSPGAVSDYWLRRSLDYIRSQPIHWFGLLVKKWLMVWNSREIEDSDDFYVYRQWSWLLNILAWLANFGVLAPLAAVGLWCTRDQWRRLWLLYAMIFILSLSVAVFFVFGRYRYPLVPVLVLFAGATVAELWRRYETRNWKGSTALVVIFLLVATVVNWPIYGQRGPGPGGYNNLSNAYYKQGNVELAVTYARKALEMAPDHGVTHYNLANLYANQGAYDLARRHFKEALRIYPDFADAHSNLGQLVAERGDLETGVKHFRRAIEIDPSVIRAHLNLGVSLAKQGRSEEALLPLSEAVRLAPDSAEYHYYLGSVFAELGRFNDAERAFKNALTVRSDFVPAHESLAQLLSSQGKREAALRHLEEARRIRSREKPQRMR